ncbi:MAG TPA: MmcQ/YjbR family DNA-binding protein [Kofleriaceae bacterium]
MPRPNRSARSPRSPRAGFAAAEAHLRDHALAKPEATEHFPWGERAIKVKGKVFLFMRADQAQLSLSTKLPRSSPVALMLPFATPTGYGLGKAGWVSASFATGDTPPIDILCSWIDESYHAVAPAKLAALAGGSTSQPAGARRMPEAATPRKPSRAAATPQARSSRSAPTRSAATRVRSRVR